MQPRISHKLFPLVTLLCWLTASAFAQTSSHTTPGMVWRVIYVRALPGKADDVLLDMRRNTRPILDEYKKQGLIVDYKFYANSTNDSPGDWDYAYAIGYRNWAALDGLTPKVAAIRLKHYGSAEKEQEANARRTQIGEQFASKLMREVTMNPLP
ncbi:MAG: hypothetical protein HYR56_33060 [Acidobacteria bacterium]|nr:hypothetical protein [Acidobacteriota bacterium]MBI3422111.1 hypothetical protein [Acidobacteriota bacterium]